MEREERSSFGEFCCKGEQKNEAVAGGKVESREESSWEKLKHVCTFDGNVLLGSGEGRWELIMQEREGRIARTCPHLHEKGWEHVLRWRSWS